MIIAFLFTSCKRDAPEKLNTIKADTVTAKKKAVVQELDFENLKKEILDKCPIKYVALVDSTNFDNHKAFRILSHKEQNLLGLNNIFIKGAEKYVEKVSIDYRLLLSTNFITVVVSYYLGEHELYTYLINYDKDFKIIDFKNIAYDEIAENYGRTTSEIWKNYITTKNYNYAVEPTEIEKSNYNIDNLGKIVKDVSR